MTASSRALRYRAALCGLVAFFLIPSIAAAQSKTARAAKSPSKAAAASVAPVPVVSIEEGLQQIKKTPKDAGAYLALGAAYRRAGQYQDAVNTYKKLVVLDPNGSSAHVSLGAAYMD